MSRPWNFQSYSNEQCLNWSFKQHQSQQNDQLNSQLKDQLHLNAQQLIKKRQSHKNKYVNKIKQCLPEQTYHSNKRLQNPSEVSKDPSQIKKYRNRQAAKQSRQRKKIYINLIQQQTRKLQQQIEQTNKQIQKCKLQINGNNLNGNQYLSTFNRKMHHIIKKLQKLLVGQQTEQINNQINLSVDSILYRFGPNGKQRNAYIKDAFKQIISLCLPHIQKYIAWSAKEQVHLFSNKNKMKNDKEIWFSSFQKIIEQAIQGKQQHIESQRVNITAKLQEILQRIMKLHLKNKDITLLSNKIDNSFFQIREILTPFQVTKFIMFVEKYKHREQFRQGQQFQKDKDQQNYQGKPKKHIKLQQVEDNFFQ